MRLKTSLAILGGGPLGNVSASVAYRKGVKDVILIEKRKHLGGTCLNEGCIPSKALIESAHILKTVRKAGDFGINVGDIKVDYGKIVKRKRQIVNTSRARLRKSAEELGYKIIHGTGTLENEHTLTVTRDGRSDIMIEFDKLLLACGSRTFIPPVEGLKREDILTSRDLLELEELPESIVIVGGGPIGVEFSSMLEIFGVKVSIIEMMDHLLFREDDDVSILLEESFKRRGIELLLGYKLEKMKLNGDNSVLYIVNKDRNKKKLKAKKVLMAVDRVSNIENLGLENAGVKIDGKFVKVNDYLQTSQPHIFAGGDLIKGYQLAHMAYYQAPLVVENILNKDMNTISGNSVPRVIYTSPEVGAVGLSEAEAIEKGIHYKKGKISFEKNLRARIMGETQGFVKVLVDEDGKVIGSSVVGPYAGELIQEMSYIIRSGGGVETLGDTIHAHPTLVELIWDVTDKL